MVIPSLFDVLTALASVLLVYVVHKYRKRDALPLPPGPKGYPVVGNLFDLPRENAWVKLHEWCQKYRSDVIHLNVLGWNVIVLDSKEAVTDLMEKRSSIYSDRPHHPMVVDMMGFGFDSPLVRYGDLWQVFLDSLEQLYLSPTRRSQRRLMHEVFHPKAAQSFQPHSLRSARRVLHRFLERPKDVCGNFRHMAGEAIMSIAYGLQVKSDNDPYINTIEDGVRILAENIEPGSNLVDLLPFLRHVPEWVPGTTFHAKAKHGRSMAYKILEVPFRAAKDRIDQGNYIPSFISHCYSQIGDQPISDSQEYIIKGTAASMYIAGLDTNINAVLGVVYGLLEHPHVLKRAQKEVDSVVPFGELPTFDDEDKLPYITALCMEAMRWKESLPIGIPHLLMEDDTYKGYRLPKGSIVMGNTWAMLHDEEAYPEPFSFNPERFIKDGKLNKEVRNPAFATFGFGRRICPCRFMAFAAVWITVASLVAAFDIEKSVDENGKVIEVGPSIESYAGLLRSPKPFECSFKPRSAKHEQTIRSRYHDES